MIPRLQPILCIAWCLFACAGCATHRKKVMPPEHREVGTVVLVNDSGRFVLIDFGARGPVPDGIALKTFSNGQETGVLTLSAERKPPFAIADIASGNPQKGDIVME